jgi:Pyruvate/2-oxoacid:ferredoxin oxidoreductase delta subunit
VLFKTLREEVKIPEPSVIITDQPCVLIDDYNKLKPYEVIDDKCTGCGNCIDVGCPAIHVTRRGKEVKPSGKEVELAFVRIETSACTGCGLCVQPCAPEAIVHATAGASPVKLVQRQDLRGRMTITNILVCGIGGQGVMTATEILAEAAIALGFDAKKTEVAGMSQRGGVVTSHLRFGPRCCRRRSCRARPTCWSASRPPRRCAGRTCCAPARSRWSTPRAGAAGGEHRPVRLPGRPDRPRCAARPRGVRLRRQLIAMELGDIRLGNTVMLGAMPTTCPFGRRAAGLRAQAFRAQGREDGRAQPRAFEAGRAAVGARPEAALLPLFFFVGCDDDGTNYRRQGAGRRAARASRPAWRRSRPRGTRPAWW